MSSAWLFFIIVPDFYFRIRLLDWLVLCEMTSATEAFVVFASFILDLLCFINHILSLVYPPPTWHRLFDLKSFKSRPVHKSESQDDLGVSVPTCNLQ